MCGIICYVGRRAALPVLLEGLKRLEYRGYDSSGVALVEDGKMRRFRAVGKIRELEKELADSTSQAQAGIGHTRWATHGKPCVENAHPHSDCAEEIFVIHNGIIENYLALKQELIKEGHVFKSETDTEVLAHLIEDAFRELPRLEDAVARALAKVRGTFGIAVLSSREPQSIIVARRSSPMILESGTPGCSPPPMFRRSWLIPNRSFTCRTTTWPYFPLTAIGYPISIPRSRSAARNRSLTGTSMQPRSRASSISC